MSFGARLFGNAATSFQETKFRWDSFMQNKKDTEENRKLARDQMDANFQMEDKRAANEKDLTLLREQISNKSVDRQWAQQVGITTLGLAKDGSYNSQQLRDLVNTYQQNDDLAVLVPALEGFYRDSIYNSPEDALNLVESALSPDGSQTVTSAQLNLALDAVKPLMGDQFDSYSKDVLAKYQEAQKITEENRDLDVTGVMLQHEDLRTQTAGRAAQTGAVLQGTAQSAQAFDLQQLQEAAKLEGLNLNNEQAEWMLNKMNPLTEQQAAAEIDNMYARTSNINQTTEAAAYELEHLTPQRVKLLKEQIENTSLQNDTMSTELTTLGQKLWVELEKERLDLDQMEDTYDAVVGSVMEQYKNQQQQTELNGFDLQLKESEVRIALATEGIQVAIQSGNLDLLTANVDRTSQEISESRQRIISMQKSDELSAEETDVRLELLKQDGILAATETLTNLRASGALTEMTTLGPELLGMLGVENPNEVIGSFLDATRTSMTQQELEQALALELLQAQVDDSQWQVANNESAFQLDKWYKENNIGLQEANLKQNADQHAAQMGFNYANLESQERQNNARIASTNSNAAASRAASAAKTGSSSGVSIDKIFDSMGLTANQFSGMLDEVSEIMGAQVDITNQGNTDQFAREGQEKINTVVGWTKQYAAYAFSQGLDPVPPPLKNNGDLARTILTQAGLITPEEGSGPLSNTSMTDTAAVGKLLYETSQGDDAVIDQGIDSAWNTMTDDERAQYKDVTGAPNINKYAREVNEEVGALEENSRTQQKALRKVNELAVSILGMQPAQGDSLDASQRAQAYNLATVRLNMIDEDTAAISSILEGVQTAIFGASFTPEQQAELNRIGAKHGMQNLDPRKLVMNLHLEREGLVDIQTAVNTYNSTF